MRNIFDERGLITKGIDDYRKTLLDRASVVFADKSDGKKLRADDSSVLGRIFSTIAKPLTENAQLLPLILQSFDLNSAQGKQLDNILWGLHRVKRKSEAKATGLVMLYGDVGVTVPQNSFVVNTMTGDSYSTDSNVTFSQTGCNGVDLEIVDTIGEISITYNIDGQLSGSPKVVLKNTDISLTKRDLALSFVNSINNQSSYLEASLNNDSTIKIKMVDDSSTGNFSSSAIANIIRTYVPVYVSSRNYNSYESKVGQIIGVGTPILGWRGVFNPYYIFPSTPIESDESYRQRGKLLQTSSLGKYNSILMALKSVRGVTYENIQQNTSSNATNTGIINNGLAVTVMGGNESEIALAIFNRISEGIMTVGNISKQVKDINGSSHTIKFSRPTTAPLEIEMSLVTYSDFPNDGIPQIKQAIVEWFNNLEVGEDVHYSRLYQPINKTSGFAVRGLKFGYKGGTLSADDVIIDPSEIATISAEDINIGGS